MVQHFLISGEMLVTYVMPTRIAKQFLEGKTLVLPFLTSEAFTKMAPYTPVDN